MTKGVLEDRSVVIVGILLALYGFVSIVTGGPFLRTLLVTVVTGLAIFVAIVMVVVDHG